MSVRWTKEQQKVIELGNRNILVSAAAGSGKTAVLVERIITMLTRAENPIDVDQLLVVTFTEAAAAEMKERIREAVEDRVEKEPDNEHLRRQATLIHSAQITTIHSFCLSVIREHFHTIDIDPSFRIGEEGELKLLRQDVLAEVLEEYYKEGDERFLKLVEGYGGGRDDKKIEELVLRLYDFSRSYPEPEQWLLNCIHAYEVKNLEELDNTAYYQCAGTNVERYLEGAEELLVQGIRICQEPDGPYMYEEMLENDYKLVRTLRSQRGYEAGYQAFQGIRWMRLAANKDKTVSEEKAGQVKRIREEVKAVVRELRELYFAQPGREVLADLKLGRPVMEILADLTISFSEQFEEKKRSRNMIDFDDMQQYALRILTREEEGRLMPSDVAEEYQKQYAEVMIDEYQDSNLIQETILTSVSRTWQGRNNIFMVGDVKQSIYRFRLSRPELFMEKYDRYPLEDGKEQRIDLHKNFRSREEVLDSVNYIFRQLMARTLGGVEYDDRAALYVGASYPETEENETELLLINSSEDEDSESWQIPGEELSAKEKEALAIAVRIKELMMNQMVVDKQTKKLRPLQYGDIVILTRSLKGFADVFAEVLKKSGIPVYAGSREGYFETREIGVLLDYLRVLNNQRQDVPLAAVMKSCFGNLTDEELAVIKGEYRDRRFYKAVELYWKEGADTEIRRKLDVLLGQMERFRKMVPYMALHKLLERIFQETGYRDYVAALPAGEQRKANLDMLAEKARAFESTSYKGLFHFIRYVEQLKKYEIEYGEANTSDEQSNTVRIMSIHKSKGLEFPIVIVAGMGKRFNRQDTRGMVLMHASLGVGLEAVDLEARTRCPSFVKNVIAREELLENMGEELRVLYVALTRAKEKLIMTGTIAEPEKKLQEAEAMNHCHSGEKERRRLSFGKLAGASTYLDWLIPAVADGGAGCPIQVKVLHMGDIRKEQIKERAGQMFTRQALEQWDTEKVYDAQMKEVIREQFGYSYPHESLEGKKLKYTVSELKKRAWLAEESGELLCEEEPVIPLIPKFLKGQEELSGASRGSAYHRVMELLDFTGDYDACQMEKTIVRMEEEGRIARDMAACVRIPDVLEFVNTASGRRMKQAAEQGLLWKEQPFVLGIPMQDVYPEMSGEEQEMVLVQGIIDVYFEEPEGLVVLDYKTDRVRTGKELLEKYQTQLEYYARALEQITGKKVKEKIIYSFTLQKEISWS
ncbi:MAG: helicase-exonuclease AddAB subunit AddA [Eubacteriales bacterium]|nr:helicase-exonuclease AddAB subunit AddA [Eubacteriales bacterium]